MTCECIRPEGIARGYHYRTQKARKTQRQIATLLRPPDENLININDHKWPVNFRE